MVNSASKPRPTLNCMGDRMIDIAKVVPVLQLRKCNVNMHGDKVEMRDTVKWIKISKLVYFEYKHSFEYTETWKEVFC